MLVWEGRGRSKYFSLAGADVAQAVEALSEIGVHQVPAAAWLGVALTDRLLQPGNTLLRDLGIDPAALGAALLDHYKRERWLLPVEGSRRLVVTPAGKSAFARFFDIDTTSI
jgi:hypothetical protein